MAAVIQCDTCGTVGPELKIKGCPHCGRHICQDCGRAAVGQVPNIGTVKRVLLLLVGVCPSCRDPDAPLVSVVLSSW
ncbi:MULTISPECIES: hypothetical protein [unclassified Frankia]|uniref:hypothetical protein n=1 Tax=unclassified Frankia TaxID=2632575 RepID=UPI0020257E4B